jgi:hypothetical protein
MPTSGNNAKRHLKGGAEEAEMFQSSQDPLLPPAGSTVSFRLCDLFAERLSRLDGAPRFEIYWPEAKRDGAVAAIGAFLDRFGARFSEQGGGFRMFSGQNEVHLLFALLDHPATPEDVARGRAVFSLDGTRRVWPLPKFPMPADWPGLKENPHGVWSQDNEGKRTNEVKYETQGAVWQAEQVLENGQWVRYFGFVGEHQVVRVPADQVDFPYRGNVGYEEWYPLTAGLDVRLTPPGEKMAAIQYDNPLGNAGSGEKLPVVLAVRNRRGVPQSALNFAAAAGPTPALPAGVQFQLSFHDLTNRKIEGDWFRPIADDGKWQQLTARLQSPVANLAPGRSLEATEEATAMTADLHDFFDVTRPGLYKVKLSFAAPFPHTGQTNDAYFVVKPPASGP